jgi:hypothetical protein
MSERTTRTPKAPTRLSDLSSHHLVPEGSAPRGEGLSLHHRRWSNPAAILQLQRIIGNRTIIGMLHPQRIQRDPDPSQPADDQLIAFAEAFNREFSSILHVFETPAADSAAAPQTESLTTDGSAAQTEPARSAESLQAEAPNAQGNRRAGTQSGNPVDPIRLRDMFTETQRQQLMAFFTSREIPDRLFNGDEVGNTTAQQRLLMSARILATGTYRPGSFVQRVHARMCFHWVHITHHYAGATPTGTLSGGVMGNFDHDGNIVFGTGSNEQVYFGSKVNADALPEAESGDLGPVPEGSGHAGALAAEVERLQENPEASRSIHRRHGMSFDRFDELQPGDWLWYYNANASGGGSHSVIFSRWASGVQTASNGVRYRAAVCFSQGTPAGGGREHNVNLGESYFSSAEVSVYPINYVTRVNADAAPAQTVEELLPASSGRREARLQADNQAYLQRIQRRYGRPVDLALVMDHLRAENRGHIAAISGHLTERQQELLNDANATENLETLIRLTQRLRMLAQNTALLERNMTSTYDGRLNEQHAQVSEQVTAEQQRIQAALEEIDNQLEPIETQIEALNAERESLDPSPQIAELRREAGQLWTDYRALPRQHPDRQRLIDERQARIAEINSLVALQRENRTAINDIRRQIVALRRQIGPLTFRRRRLQQDQSRNQATLPYGLVHPGGLNSQARTRMSGKLEEMFSITQMRDFLTQPAQVMTP